MKKKRVVKERKPVLLFILGLTTVTLIGLFFQEPAPLKMSPGVATSVMIPTYILSSALLFISGILLIYVSRKNA